MNIRPHIPNLFTIGNLVCGSLAVILIAQEGFIHWAVLLIGLAGILDVFDGAVARALGVSSPIGRELDSLADVISFGLAPSVMVYSMMETLLPSQFEFLKYIAFLNVVCAAIRLAKFNISTDQTTDFSGMPSPANGIFWASIGAYFWEILELQTSQIPGWHITYFTVTKFTPFVLLGLAILFVLTSLLMVSKIRMFSFKFKKGGFATNKIPFIFIGTVLLFPFITWFGFHSFFLCVPLGILWYIVLSFVYHFNLKKEVA
ncbi:MAG: CDP-alcohol phosphatidyltransferase family protein [Flavobacteriales bacterium]